MGKIGDTIKLIILLALLAGAVYVLLEAIKNNYGESIDLESEEYAPEVNMTIESYSNGELQFDNNMRFNKNKLTYIINSECSEIQKEGMRDAFDFLQNETKYLTFKELTLSELPKDKNADIIVLCGEHYVQQVAEENTYIAGEGGPVMVINTTLFDVILYGKIVLYKKSCSYNVELHELLHVFGFRHSNNEDSIMYPISNCKQDLTNDIIKELDRLYNIEPLPDLYFEKVNASKHGIYLDTTMIIKNQGIIDSDNVSISIFSDGKKVEELDIGMMEFGSGKILTTKNIKLSSRKASEIELVLDYENKIEEYSKTNNIMKLRVS